MPEDRQFRTPSPLSQFPESSGADSSASSGKSGKTHDTANSHDSLLYGHSSAASAKLSQLPHLDTALEYPNTSVEAATDRRHSSSGSIVHKTAVKPQSILSSKVQPSTDQTMYSVSVSRSTSTISFQVPPSKPRGSISAHPSAHSGGPAPQLPTTPRAEPHHPEIDVATPTARTPRQFSGGRQGPASQALRARSPPSRQLSLSNDEIHRDTISSATFPLETCSPVIAHGRNTNSPLAFELPERQHPLQHFTFPTEDAVPQQTNSAGPEPRSPSSSTSSVRGLLRSPAPARKGKTAVLVNKQPKTVVSTPTGPPVPFTEYLCKEDDNKIHILLGATGSVASIKIPLIIEKLFKVYSHDRVSIQLVVTRAAEHFLRGLKIPSDVKIWRENEEWSNPNTHTGDPILHIELRKWADILLIAPTSANSLAKIANGLADNLLTSIVRAWNPTIPIIMAPAMNTFMYTHPVTKKHLQVIHDEFKFVEVLKPIEKVLVCGDIGMGGMREWSDVVDIVVKRLKEAKKMERQKLEEQAYEGDEEQNEEEGEDDDEEEENEDEDEGEDDDDDDDDDDDEEEEEDDDDDDDEDEDDDDDDDDDKPIDTGESGVFEDAETSLQSISTVLHEPA